MSELVGLNGACVACGYDYSNMKHKYYCINSGFRNDINNKE